MPEGIVPLEEMEREMVARAMRAAGDNQTARPPSSSA